MSLLTSCLPDIFLALFLAIVILPYLRSLSQKSLNCPHSMFAQDNLFPSLKMIEKWDKENLPSTEIITNKWNKTRYEVSQSL